MTARREANDKDVIGVDMKFFCMVADEFHRRGSIHKRNGPTGAAMTRYGISKHERIEACGHVRKCDRFALSVRAKFITAARNDENGFAFFVERHFFGGACNVCSKGDVGFFRVKVKGFYSHVIIHCFFSPL